MANHLQLMNESFDKIIIKETSPVLFEEFCEECSESGVSKEDILDWLYQHEQLVQDCEEHFGQDASWASADELEAFISDHDTAWKDYAEHFDLEDEEDDIVVEESLINESTGLYKITPQEQEAFDSLDDETLKDIKLVIRTDVSYTGTREAMIQSVLTNLHSWGTSYSDETLRNATEYILKKGKYHSRYPYSMRYKNESYRRTPIKEDWTKMMFDFKHNGSYDEEALKNVIDQELKRQGLDWTGYVDFDAVDYSGYDLDENLTEALGGKTIFIDVSGSHTASDIKKHLQHAKNHFGDGLRVYYFAQKMSETPDPKKTGYSTDTKDIIKFIKKNNINKNDVVVYTDDDVPKSDDIYKYAIVINTLYDLEENLKESLSASTRRDLTKAIIKLNRMINSKEHFHATEAFWDDIEMIRDIIEACRQEDFNSSIHESTFGNIDHAYTENLKESYSSIIDHLNDAFEEIINDGYSLSDMNDIVKEELREFIMSYKAAHKHEE